MAPWVHTPRPHPTQTNQTHQLKNELIELTNSRCQRSQREWGITKYSYNSFGPSALHIPNKASNLRRCKGISEWFVGTHLNSFVASGVKSKKRSCFAPPSAFIFLILGHFFQLGVSKFLALPVHVFCRSLSTEWVSEFVSFAKQTRACSAVPALDGRRCSMHICSGSCGRVSVCTGVVSPLLLSPTNFLLSLAFLSSRKLNSFYICLCNWSVCVHVCVSVSCIHFLYRRLSQLCNISGRKKAVLPFEPGKY